MQSNELMAAAAPQTVRIVAGVRADQLDAPTPCTEWTVRTLLNHLITWSAKVNALAAAHEPVPASVKETDYLAAGGWADDYAATLDQAVRNWAEPGALAGEVSLGGDPMAATLVADMFFGELVMHGWDLAKATGQQFQCADEVANAAADVVREFEYGREFGVYSDKVTVPGDASALDRALALSGRDPAWTAG